MKTHVRHNQDGSFDLVPGPKPKASQLSEVRDAMVGLMNTLQPYAQACSRCGMLESPTGHDDDCPMTAAIKVMPWLNEKTGILAESRLKEKVGPEPAFDSQEPSEVPK